MSTNPAVEQPPPTYGAPRRAKISCLSLRWHDSNTARARPKAAITKNRNQQNLEIHLNNNSKEMWQPVQTQELNTVYTHSDLVNKESALSSCSENETSLIICHVCLPLEPTDPQRAQSPLPVPSTWSQPPQRNTRIAPECYLWISVMCSVQSPPSSWLENLIYWMSTTAVFRSCFYHHIAADSKYKRR